MKGLTTFTMFFPYINSIKLQVPYPLERGPMGGAPYIGPR